MSIPGIQSIGIRGIRDAIVAPSEVRAVVVYKPRSQCCDFIVSCFLTCVLYFFVYFFYIPLTVQCESDDSSVQVEGWYYGLDIMDFGDLVLSIVIAGAGYYFVWECWSSSDWYSLDLNFGVTIVELVRDLLSHVKLPDVRINASSGKGIVKGARSALWHKKCSHTHIHCCGSSTVVLPIIHPGSQLVTISVSWKF